MKLLLVLAMAAATTAAAQQPATPDPVEHAIDMLAKGELKIDLAAPRALSAQEKADSDMVVRATTPDTGANIVNVRRDLELILSHAPARYPMIEAEKGVVISRTPDTPPYMRAAIAAGVASLDGGKTLQIGFEHNVYGMAAGTLGYIALEQKRPEDALRFLDRGLTFQPDNPRLVSERGQALAALGRFDEALAGYDAWLQRYEVFAGLLTDQSALLLRSRGFALIELGRLDQAQASYEASLKLDPSHQGAQSELTYIAQLRAGAGKSPGVILDSDVARTTPP
jgi:tetratricopeptide (TPR) repeat protein